MAGKKEPGTAWRHTTVLVRSDIFEGARERDIDISDTCNRALAGILGIDYRQQRLDDVPVPSPVIIARDGGLPAHEKTAVKSPERLRPPVINADDPSAAGDITRTKKVRVHNPSSEPPAQTKTLAEERDSSPTKKPDTSRASRSVKAPMKKPKKEDRLKKFITTKIIRDDAGDAAIPKDELYQSFSRWCRDQKISPVPDAKTVTVALKTRFAFKERRVGGSPCWMNVRYR